MTPPTDDGPRRRKSITRRTVLSRRDALTVELRSTASAAIAEHALDVIPATGIVSLYAGKGTEVATADLDRLLRARGQTVAYPRILDGSRHLTFHVVEFHELRAGKFGILEPTFETLELPVTEIATFVIPGLGFDRHGARIGWGRGHYDTTLTANDGALRVGLAFACQMMDEIPLEPHDLRLDAIVTEDAVYRVTR